MRTLVIGDIQGCKSELDDLLEKAALSGTDQMIALGDMVDRGPASPEVFDFFVSRPNARSLMGNHERKHVRSFRGEVRPALSQIITREQFGEQRYSRAIERMDTFPRYLELPEAVLVHGFFEPGVPLHLQREAVIVGTLTGESFLKCRYNKPWYELYDGKKPIIVGHRDYLRTGKPLVHNDRVFGLDTNCCRGGRLTGLVLPDFRVVSVASRGDHWIDTRRLHEYLKAEAVPEDSLTWGETEKFLQRAKRRPYPSSGERERAARIADLVAEAEACIEKLLEHVRRENDRALSALRRESRFDELTPQEQGRAYAERIGKTPLSRFLHVEPKGLLTEQHLRTHFRKPAEAIAFAKQIQDRAQSS